MIDLLRRFISEIKQDMLLAHRSFELNVPFQMKQIEKKQYIEYKIIVTITLKKFKGSNLKFICLLFWRLCEKSKIQCSDKEWRDVEDFKPLNLTLTCRSCKIMPPPHIFTCSSVISTFAKRYLGCGSEYFHLLTTVSLLDFQQWGPCKVLNML